MALAIGSVITAISGLSISGVTIADDSAIPPDVALTRKQYLYPEPANPISDIGLTIDSFGQYDIAKMTLTYTLNYTYWHTPIGDGRTGLDVYSAVVEAIALIIDALAQNVLTTIPDIRFNVGSIEPVQDPAGNMGLGCIVSLVCKEFIN